jgi:hypothetical protein
VGAYVGGEGVHNGDGVGAYVGGEGVHSVGAYVGIDRSVNTAARWTTASKKQYRRHRRRRRCSHTAAAQMAERAEAMAADVLFDRQRHWCL